MSELIVFLTLFSFNQAGGSALDVARGACEPASGANGFSSYEDAFE